MYNICSLRREGGGEVFRGQGFVVRARKVGAQLRWGGGAWRKEAPTCEACRAMGHVLLVAVCRNGACTVQKPDL